MTINPYQSPLADAGASYSHEISDQQVKQLLGAGAIELVVADLSDNLLYGRKHKRELSGELATTAKKLGCRPLVYQAVYWFCLAFIPLYPRGVYYVLPLSADDQDDEREADSYRVIPAPWDSAQILLHFLVLVGFVSATLASIWWFTR